MPSSEAREMYLKTKLTEDTEIKQWVEDTEGFSIAHLKELFVATKILGDSYDRALAVLKSMKRQPDSRTFDDYGAESLDHCPTKYSQKCSEPCNPESIAESLDENIRFNSGRKLLLG